MKLTIRKHGKTYVLKVCKGCGDEWYALPKQNRCTLCGTGLRRVRQGEDTTKSPDIQEGMTRENRKLIARLPLWLQQELGAAP